MFCDGNHRRQRTPSFAKTYQCSSDGLTHNTYQHLKPNYSMLLPVFRSDVTALPYVLPTAYSRHFQQLFFLKSRQIVAEVADALLCGILIVIVFK
jgi:hypothetical protein